MAAVLLSAQQAQRIARLWQRHQDGDGRALPMLVTLYREWLASLERQRSLPGVLFPAALRTDLADALFALARQVNDQHSHDEALAAAAEAVSVTTAQDPHRASRRTILGRLHEFYFDHGAGPRALERAVGEYRHAAQLSWRQQPTDLNCAVRLASAQRRLHEASENPPVELLLEATAVWRDAVTCTAPDDPELEARLRQLNETANLLVDAVGVGPVQRMLSAAQEPGVLDQLFAREEELHDRIEVDASALALAERRDAALMLFASVPAFHSERPRALLALCGADTDRWQHGGEPDGVVRATIWADVALAAAGPEHPLRRQILNSLSYAAGIASQHRRSDSAAETAVDAARAALELVDEQSEHRPRQLAVLANALAYLGLSQEDPGALDEALRYLRESLEHTSTDDVNYPVRLMTLGRVLVERDLFRPDEALLAEAVQVDRAALGALPGDDARRVGFTYNLAASLSQYATRRQDADGLLASERVYQDALSLLPYGHPDHPRIRSALAETRYRRYLIDGDITVLASAAELAGQAVDRTPADNPWWPIRARIRARAAAELARLGGADAERARAEASAAYAALAASPLTQPQVRLDAERQRAALTHEATDPVARLAALERAVQRMPEIASRSAAGRRRLTALGSAGGLAAEAAAAAIAAQQPDRAVDLLERGRGLLFHETLGIRAARARLRTVDPAPRRGTGPGRPGTGQADAYTQIASSPSRSSADRRPASCWPGFHANGTRGRPGSR